MKTFIVLLVTLIIFFPGKSSAQIEHQHPLEQSYAACIDASNGVTFEILNCIDLAYIEWDEQLNYVYQELRRRLNKKAQQVLRDAQREWITFRDLEFRLQDELFNLMPNGTMYSIIFAEQRMEFVKKRVLELETYLELLKGQY